MKQAAFLGSLIPTLNNILLESHILMIANAYYSVQFPF